MHMMAYKLMQNTLQPGDIDRQQVTSLETDMSWTSDLIELIIR